MHEGVEIGRQEAFFSNFCGFAPFEPSLARMMRFSMQRKSLYCGQAGKGGPPPAGMKKKKKICGFMQYILILPMKADKLRINPQSLLHLHNRSI
jgi:hypothetical protein